PSASSFCGRSSLAFAGWGSWPMSGILAPCWKWARLRLRPARSPSRSSPWKSGEPRISGRPSKGPKDAPMRFMSLPTPLANRIRINTLALAARLPTMQGVREYVEAGGLMSYGPNLADGYRRAADYVDKILRGAKPGDIPVEQPTKFDLVLNLTTAKALGLTIP